MPVVGHSTEGQIFNQILFSAGGESWTAQDLVLYEKVLNEVFKRKAKGAYSESPVQDFIFSRLSYKEAKVFDLVGEKIKISESGRKKLGEFTAAEIEKEAEQISNALAFIEIRENMVKQEARFKSFVDVLKRKYQFKDKSAK